MKNRVWQVGVILLILFLAGACSKKVTPPEVESIGTSTMGDSSSTGAGGSGAGGAGGGDGSGFGIQEQPAGMGGGLGDGSGGGGAGGGAGGGSGGGAGGGFAQPGLSSEEKAMQEARMLPFHDTSDLGDIHFAFDKYDLDDSSKKILQKNASWLKEHPAVKVEIQGHCDERGTNNYNLGLGERRANATKQYLIALGVDGGRLFTISYGEEKPFCTESNENCWRQNRRAHFMVSSPQ